MDLYDQLQSNISPGPSFEPDHAVALPLELPARLIAYYLPQFHSVPENDAWWGKGFTEWTNVTKSVPRFPGHYQPHLPGDLGFYDLSQPETLRRQAAMARQYGVHGFCFHYYWFSGRKILETPLNNLLNSPDIDLPFCINWANENWTRRWDGKNSDVLLAQKYSERDDVEIAKAFTKIVRDARYITVQGRPLIMVYRPLLIPDIVTTVARWREIFATEGLPNPYFVMPQNDGDLDPRKHGFDAAAGFPPHACWDEAKSRKANEIDPRLQKDALFDKAFSGKIYEYEDVAAAALAKKAEGYRLFPGITPNWDNDPRQPGRGRTIVGSTPSAYGQWLRDACDIAVRAAEPDERLVFVNAWNEWAEGAHLEPDRHFGYAYLAETRRALTGARSEHRSDLVDRKVVTATKPKFGMGLGLRARTADALEMLADIIR